MKASYTVGLMNITYLMS